MAGREPHAHPPARPLVRLPARPQRQDSQNTIFFPANFPSTTHAQNQSLWFFFIDKSVPPHFASIEVVEYSRQVCVCVRLAVHPRENAKRKGVRGAREMIYVWWCQDPLSVVIVPKRVQLLWAHPANLIIFFAPKTANKKNAAINACGLCVLTPDACDTWKKGERILLHLVSIACFATLKNAYLLDGLCLVLSVFEGSVHPLTVTIRSRWAESIHKTRTQIKWQILA